VISISGLRRENCTFAVFLEHWLHSLTRVWLYLLLPVTLGACGGAKENVLPIAVETTLPSQQSLESAPFTTTTRQVSTSTVIYSDDVLCFTVRNAGNNFVVSDGVKGGFAIFSNAGTQDMVFNVANGGVAYKSLEEMENSVRKSEIGKRIIETRPLEISGRRGAWIAFEEEQEFKYLVLVHTPRCNGENKGLFISSRAPNRERFETFVNSIQLESR
jgi:hypothetical protein